MKIGSETIPLLDPNNDVDCGVQIKELKCSDIFTSSTVIVPNIFEACNCVTYPDLSGGLMYTISDVADIVTLLTCNDKTKFDTKFKCSMIPLKEVLWLGMMITVLSRGV